MALDTGTCPGNKNNAVEQIDLRTVLRVKFNMRNAGAPRFAWPYNRHFIFKSR